MNSLVPITALLSGIIGGGELTEKYPAVVALNRRCTAAFITDRVLITAAHCISRGQLRRHRADSSYRIPLRLDGIYSGKARVVFRSPEMNPSLENYDTALRAGMKDFTVNFDQALILLPRPLKIAPFPVCEEAIVPGDPVSLVGYGYDLNYENAQVRNSVSALGIEPRSLGQKRLGKNVIHTVASELLFLKGLFYTPRLEAPGDRHLTQAGDSGGPLIRKETSRGADCITGTLIGAQVGLTGDSGGEQYFLGEPLADNEGVSTYQRLDTPEAKAWLAKWIVPPEKR